MSLMEARIGHPDTSYQIVAKNVKRIIVVGCENAHFRIRKKFK